MFTENGWANRISRETEEMIESTLNDGSVMQLKNDGFDVHILNSGMIITRPQYDFYVRTAKGFDGHMQITGEPYETEHNEHLAFIKTLGILLCDWMPKDDAKLFLWISKHEDELNDLLLTASEFIDI